MAISGGAAFIKVGAWSAEKKADAQRRVYASPEGTFFHLGDLTTRSRYGHKEDRTSDRENEGGAKGHFGDGRGESWNCRAETRERRSIYMPTKKGFLCRRWHNVCAHKKKGRIRTGRQCGGGRLTKRGKRGRLKGEAD